MSNNESNPIHITWQQIFVFLGTFGIPILTLVVTVIIFGTRLTDKVEAISNSVQTISNRQDRAEDKINHINSKVDTIERRQAIYQATHK